MPNTAGSEECAQTSLRGIDRKVQDSVLVQESIWGAEYRDAASAWRKLKKSSAIADDDITVEEYRNNLKQI